MKNSYLPILVVICGATFYQVAQKSLSKDVNPLLVIIIAYTIGIIACSLCWLTLPQEQTLADTIKGFNWAVVGVGISAVMIEIGFLLAYRSGWHISITSLITSITVCILLIPIGLFFYKEPISLSKGLGIMLCILGLFLISRR